MDVGLWPGNYFDCDDNAVALQREADLMDGITGTFYDTTFPPNTRSLYFDLHNVPKGSIPVQSLRWDSISEGSVLNCDSPVLFAEDRRSPLIKQGALGNKYFISALKLLACEPRYLKRLLVSDKFASQGCYTWRINKCGKWRYVHIDDRIPCRLSGHVNFARNENRNETFAMLIEKAYAKIHGCYESLNYGLIEKVIPDLTESAHVQVFREDVLEMESGADLVWDAMESGFATNKLIGCGRWLEDPYTENGTHRQGILLGCMYQVVDCAAVTAAATAELDALTVGMVCIRILEKSGGRFLGRWSYGHQLWTEYPEIGDLLYARTVKVQQKLGLMTESDASREQEDRKSGSRKVASTSTNVESTSASAPATSSWKAGAGFPEFNDEEADDVDVRKSVMRAVSKSQPEPCEFFWMQIEDFVDMFNRVYIVTDVPMQAESAIRAKTKRFYSKWIPGDYLGGSSGPPVLYGAEPEEEADDQADNKSLASVDQDSKATEALPVPVDPGSVGPKETKLVYTVNEQFTDNPMYPFSVSEPAIITISLYQADRRWSADRLDGISPAMALTAHFANRKARLSHCMEYPTAIAFVILRLNGLKYRVTEFKLRKLIYKSDNEEKSNVVSCSIELRPGRYAIVPYTPKLLNRAKDYILCCSYTMGTVEFEIEDLHAQRLVDTVASDDDTEEEDENENDEDDNTDEISKGSTLQPAANKDPLSLVPTLLNLPKWAYEEDMEEQGILSVYEEVGCLTKYVQALRKEVLSVDSGFQEISTRLAALGPKVAAEKKVSRDIRNTILKATSAK